MGTLFALEIARRLAMIPSSLAFVKAERNEQIEFYRFILRLWRL